MNIDFVLIADAVDSVNNKLFVMGGCWETVTASSFPASVKIGIGTHVFLSPADVGGHSIEIKFADETGTDIAPPIKGQIQILPPIQTRGASIAINHLLTLPRAGTYSVQVMVDDQRAEPVRFEVKLALSS